MEEEFKKQAVAYYGKMEQRKKFISSKANEIATKSIIEDKIEKDLNYIAGVLLQQKEFNFDKDRLSSKSRVRFRNNKLLQTCYFRCSTWSDVDLIDEYRSDEKVLSITPVEFQKSVNEIKSIIGEYKQKREEFDGSNNYERKVNLNVTTIGDWGGIKEHNIILIRLQDLTSPDNIIEDDNYYNEALKHLEEIRHKFDGINNSYDTAMDKIKTILNKYNDILVLRDL